MTDRFRLTLGQQNPTVGDLDGNADKALAVWREGRAAGADMVALPEMFLSGYQVQDLVLKPAFTAHCRAVLERLARDAADGPALGIGAPWVEAGVIFNAYHVLKDGEVAARVFKHHRPNYNVFDEVRTFAEGPVAGPYRIGDMRIGTPICEDAWYPDVTETLAETGAELLLVPNGSPYRRGKFDVRMSLMVARTVETGLPLVYLNMTGGQDDQIFDGGSFVLNPHGDLAVQLPLFDDAVAHVDFERTDGGWRAAAGARAVHPGDLEQDYRAMVTGLRDYCAKTGFASVLLGLSGGVDSALVAAIAADALGPDALRCVMLPSEYTSDASLHDAALCARALGCRLDEVSIEGPRKAVGDALADLFAGTEPGLTEENIQSRLRGLTLMAISNKTGAMLLTTGNKSEAAVGYATIYGDMAGGYNPVKDLWKTRLFDVCRWRNAHHRGWMKGPAGEVVPQRIIDKPPSAELRPDQRDDDSLPPYDVLDAILHQLVDLDASVADVVALGFDRDLVERVEHLVYTSEYKRFQSAPGARLTQRAFWLDRRYPIANRWRDPS
ncbi:NAD(+) synthase [Oceaniovalibus guishaninsula JLT2003]|uniref:Glutamine-dependent NAD(+) synthetase n=1 Tax=Oceaniovalibus guishaninsula JLT2003 TaxID=1231392 RepID=K2I4Q5_9RHOB|nr:NAD+ synthase [Oceaniovalibus guishaninsula]EKE43905.1 NAD(+) synthase [Oceaniovalibus guishaninsula JLT2003]